jgi:hypothetical protein
LTANLVKDSADALDDFPHGTIAGGAGKKPPSTAPFPANREINREFRKFRASAAISASNQRANSKACKPNSLRNGTGNFCSPNREFFRDNREFNRASSEGAELLSGRRISTALDVNSFGTSAA